MTETALRPDPVYTLESVNVELPGRGGPCPVLDGVALDIAPGEIVGIVGRSGVGKTPLLRVLAGLPRPRDQLASRALPQYLHLRALLGEALRDAQ